MFFRLLPLIIFFLCNQVRAQGDGPSPSKENHTFLADVARNARNPKLPAFHRTEIVTGLAQYIQKCFATHPQFKEKTPEERRQFFTNNPTALDKLEIPNNDPLRLLITEYGLLLNSIEASEKLKRCSANQEGIEEIANKFGNNYSICDQGQRAYGSILWSSEQDPKVKNSLPNYFYFDNFQTISKLVDVANYSGLEVTSAPNFQLGDSIEKIKAQNPDKSEDEIFKIAKQIELRQLAYLRAVTNSYKTVAMVRTLFQSPGLDIKNIADLNDEIKSNCEGCSSEQVKKIIGEISTSLNRDIENAKLKKRTNLEITNSICDKLKDRGYKPELKNEFDQNASDKEVISKFDRNKGLVSDTVSKKKTPGILIEKPDSNKVYRGFDQAANEKEAILATVGDGWEGLLLLTPTLTKKLPDNSPYRVNLDCLNRENPVNDTLISSASHEARMAPVEYVQGLNNSINFDKTDVVSVMTELKTLIKENKRAIGESLVTKPELTEVVCSISKEVDRDFAISDAKSMALTWGTMVAGGALEFTGVGAPLGAWLQGTIIATEVVGGLAVAHNANENSKKLEIEAKGKLGSALSTGGDENLLKDAWKTKEAANGLSEEARFEAAMAALAIVNPFLKLTQVKGSPSQIGSKTTKSEAKMYFENQSTDTKSTIGLLIKSSYPTSLQEEIYEGLYDVHLAGGPIDGQITTAQLRLKAEKIQSIEKHLIEFDAKFDPKEFRNNVKNLMDDGVLGLFKKSPEVIPEQLQLILKYDPDYLKRKVARTKIYEKNFSSPKEYGYKIPQFVKGYNISKEDILYRDAFVAFRAVLGDEKKIYATMQELEDEIITLCYKKNPDYNSLANGTAQQREIAFRIKEESLDQILGEKEAAHGFVSSASEPGKYKASELEQKIYSKDDWFEMLSEGLAFNDIGFAPIKIRNKTSKNAGALVDTPEERKRHGVYTHRIQFYILMTAIDKANSRKMAQNPFGGLRGVDLFKKLGDQRFMNKLGIDDDPKTTMWQMLLDSFSKSHYHSPEYFRQQHENWPELGPWLKLENGTFKL